MEAEDRETDKMAKSQTSRNSASHIGVLRFNEESMRIRVGRRSKERPVANLEHMRDHMCARARG